jgi:hypothetical protein
VCDARAGRPPWHNWQRGGDSQTTTRSSPSASSARGVPVGQSLEHKLTQTESGGEKGQNSPWAAAAQLRWSMARSEGCSGWAYMTIEGYGSHCGTGMRLETTRRIDSPGGRHWWLRGSSGRGVAWLAPRAVMVCNGSSVPAHRGGEVVRWLPTASDGGQNKGPATATLR